MRKMTEEFLKASFAGEAQAHMRYLAFAKKAEEEGKPNIARLFRAIAFAEEVHATNHYRTLGMINDTSANLQVAIDGENFEVEEMYPAYNAVAKLQDEKAAERSTKWAWEAEKVHSGMYQRAKQAADMDKDPTMGTIYICEICGWTGEGEPPERCPVCGAAKDKFRKF